MFKSRGYRFSSSNTTTEQPLLFLNYTRASTDNISTVFADGENISADVAIQHSSISYSANVASSTTFTATSTDVKSATGPASRNLHILFNPGVFYVRGFFVAVTNQVLTLDPYDREFSGFVGFDITETLTTPETDTTLLDNAQGSSNFAAKGAHRLQISLTLIRKQLLLIQILFNSHNSKVVSLSHKVETQSIMFYLMNLQEGHLMSLVTIQFVLSSFKFKNL